MTGKKQSDRAGYLSMGGIPYYLAHFARSAFHSLTGS